MKKKTKNENKKEKKYTTKEINRERWCTNYEQTKQAFREKEKKKKKRERKKNPRFRCNDVLVLVVLMLLLQHPVLEFVFE
jgi:hypothetical protein